VSPKVPRQPWLPGSGVAHRVIPHPWGTRDRYRSGWRSRVCTESWDAQAAPGEPRPCAVPTVAGCRAVARHRSMRLRALMLPTACWSARPPGQADVAGADSISFPLENHRIVEWFGLEGSLQIIQFQPLCHGQGPLPPAPSNLALHGQCLTTLRVKNFFLRSRLNLPSFSPKPSPLVPSLPALVPAPLQLSRSPSRPWQLL